MKVRFNFKEICNGCDCPQSLIIWDCPEMSDEELAEYGEELAEINSDEDRTWMFEYFDILD